MLPVPELSPNRMRFVHPSINPPHFHLSGHDSPLCKLNSVPSPALPFSLAPFGQLHTPAFPRFLPPFCTLQSAFTIQSPTGAASYQPGAPPRVKRKKNLLLIFERSEASLRASTLWPYVPCAASVPFSFHGYTLFPRFSPSRQ